MYTIKVKTLKDELSKGAKAYDLSISGLQSHLNSATFSLLVAQMRKRSEAELDVMRSAIKASLAQLERTKANREAYVSEFNAYIKELANGKDTIIVFDSDITSPEP